MSLAPSGLPAASFAAIGPPADGLALAFAAARRRRNSKGAVTGFGGAAAVIALLALTAPPGQTLLQEPLPPAHGGLLPADGNVPDPVAPKVAPGAVVLTVPAVTQMPRAVAPTDLSLPVVRAVRPRAAAKQLHSPRCTTRDRIACVAVRAHTPGGRAAARAAVCPAAAELSVSYAPPDAQQLRLMIAPLGQRAITVSTGDCHTGNAS